MTNASTAQIRKQKYKCEKQVTIIRHFHTQIHLCQCNTKVLNIHHRVSLTVSILHLHTRLTHTHTHTHTRLMALCLGLLGSASTRKVKPIWILVKQETVSGSGIGWTISKSAPRSRQITTPTPQRSVFYRPDALPAAQPTASKHWRQTHLHINATHEFCWKSQNFLQLCSTNVAKCHNQNEPYAPLKLILHRDRCKHKYL